jgi:hypothetical protein
MESDPAGAVQGLWRLLNATTKEFKIHEKKNLHMSDELSELQDEIADMKEDERENVEKLLKYQMTSLEK